MSLLLDVALAMPWAMEEEPLRGLLTIAAREHDLPSPQTLEAYRAVSLERAERAGVRDGVAILDVEGPLIRRAGMFDAISGATSYEILRRDLAAVLDDPAVGAVLLNINSPGGEAYGVAELAQAIYDARGSKPITAYVGSLGASAAYWIASAADEIVANEASVLGSIGVRMALVDRRAAQEKAGLRTIEFVSSQSPAKLADPASDDGRARIQKTIDALAEVFVTAVARNRAVSRETVLSAFGAGGVEVGAAAVQVGLADRLGTFEDTLSTLAAPLRGRPGFLTMKGPAMADQPTTTTPTLTAETVQRDHPAIAEHFRAEGATAERARITRIQALALPGSETLVAEAISAGTSPEAFAVRLVEAERARSGARLQALAGDEAALKPPAPGAVAGEGDDVAATVAAIMNAARK